MFADARPAALLAQASWAIVLTDVRATALLAPVSLTVVLAGARPAAVLALASSAVVLADARAAALLARASSVVVLADDRPVALLASFEEMNLKHKIVCTANNFVLLSRETLLRRCSRSPEIMSQVLCRLSLGLFPNRERSILGRLAPSVVYLPSEYP